MEDVRELDIEGEVSDRPHVVFLGSGASRAAVPMGDKHGKKLPLVKELVEVVGLEGLLDGAGITWRDRDFEEVFSGITDNNIIERIIDMIDVYFDDIEIPETVTAYDHLVLSLRKKDVVATFNWDPLILQALARHPQPESRPDILLLHGNIRAGICRRDRRKGTLFSKCSKCGMRLEQTKIFYLTHHKKYDEDHFIAGEWAEFEEQISRAGIVTVYGYAAPPTDSEARNRMLRAWNENPYRNFAEFEIINTAKHSDAIAPWKEFIVNDHYHYRKSLDQSYLAHFPRRSVEALQARDMLLQPWSPTLLPSTTDLLELQASATPLIQQECRWPTTKQ